ncbi:MAG: hypothetical protein NZL96_02630 [Patescibacteria group bacterium]|nr:hypothetical protein [Patescibacteria group bacterium]
MIYFLLASLLIKNDPEVLEILVRQPSDDFGYKMTVILAVIFMGGLIAF